MDGEVVQREVAALQNDVFELAPGEAVPIVEPDRLVLPSFAPERFYQLELVSQDSAVCVGSVPEELVVARPMDVGRPIRTRRHDVTAMPGQRERDLLPDKAFRAGRQLTHLVATGPADRWQHLAGDPSAERPGLPASGTRRSGRRGRSH